jgi:putative membrane protein
MERNNLLPNADAQKLASLKKWSILLSVVILALIGMMRRVKFDLGFDFSFLPLVNALSNTVVSICLILAFYYIKQRDWVSHRKFIYSAMIFSGIFLLSYVLYHFTTQETSYCHGEGLMKNVYYFLLITHIVMAGISLPFILITYSRGASFHVEMHRRMARWVFPIWLYVAMTGPLCYLMLRDCY